MQRMLAMNPAIALFTGVKPGPDGRPDAAALERALSKLESWPHKDRLVGAPDRKQHEFDLHKPSALLQDIVHRPPPA